ncbi:MAG: hypothetical protein HY290_22385 [Planctomycetia bacterium]|nr:hypothetical protein [Planctomycetia bacterium]
MAEFVCPECQAEIHADLIETTGRAECPFCGADLSSLGLPQPAELPSANWDAGDSSEARSIARVLPALPQKSRINVVESTADRLVFYFPGGGAQSTGLGCFALMWNGFMAVFTSAMVFGVAQGGNNNQQFPELGAIAFVGLFWAVGLGMAYFWIRMRFERTFLLLERQRVVIQKVLINRKRVDETVLMPESRAELVEAYSQNDSPVYRIELRGQTRAAKFGTSLSEAEKDWLVDRINEFLAPPAETNPATNPAAGLAPPETSATPDNPALPADQTVAPATPVAVRLEPGSLPADGPIRMDEDSPDMLKFHFTAAQNRGVRWGIAGFFLLFSAIWYGTTLSFLFKVGPSGFGFRMLFEILFMVPFLVVGLFPLGMGLMAAFGVLTVRVTRETLSCRWSVGPFGWTKRVPAGLISSVRLEAPESSNPRVRRAGMGAKDSVSLQACVVRFGEKKLLLTLFQNADLQQQVTALVRTRLEDMGYVLRNA